MSESDCSVTDILLQELNRLNEMTHRRRLLLQKRFKKFKRNTLNEMSHKLEKCKNDMLKHEQELTVIMLKREQKLTVIGEKLSSHEQELTVISEKMSSLVEIVNCISDHEKTKQQRIKDSLNIESK